MLSITCRCILYALVSVVVPWGVALGWVRMRLGGEKSTVYSLQKARLHHWFEGIVQLKIQSLSSFTQPHVFPNQSSLKPKLRNV